MGIRYYAYAFNSDQAATVMTDPMSIVPGDPLADAWGFEPGTMGLINPTGKQTTPERDMLYLDKLWMHLQDVTGPYDDHPARPSYRMFEGSLRWDTIEPWSRALLPKEMAAIARDLGSITDCDATKRVQANHYFGRRPEANEVDMALEYLHKACVFVDGLVRDGRGMVYTIG